MRGPRFPSDPGLIPQSFPVRFTPNGLVDAFDATDMFEGACLFLQNLCFDQSNPECVITRPGVGTALTTFSSFSSPGFISVHIGIGSRVYGMLATARNAGNDEPFCYDTAISSFVTISGVTAGNTPASPASSGAWNPPSMAVIGTKIVITHPGFSGTGSNFFGVIDITTPSAPAWSAANTTTNGLPAVPAWVVNYNNRAYFVIGNKLYYSDVLVLNLTSNQQFLTVGDPTALVCLVGLPVQTSTSGVVQTLQAFKPTQIWQISGDPSFSLSPLSQNFLSLTVGTTAPRSVVQTPDGIYFIFSSGPHFIDPLGIVRPLLGIKRTEKNLEQDVQAPFQNATQPSRMAAAYGQDIYRISLATLDALGNSGSFDYWFDRGRKRWNGPHTFAYDCISVIGTYFVLSGASHGGTGAALYKSQVIADSTTTFVDEGNQYTCHLQSSALPKRNPLAQKQMVESLLELASTGGASTYSISVLDDQRNTVANLALTTALLGKAWGSNKWGDGSVWSSAVGPPHPYELAWPFPLQFQKMLLDVNCSSSNRCQIGTFFGRWQDLGFPTQPP